MAWKPTPQLQAVGWGGVAGAVAMAAVDQVAPGAVDWSHTVMGVPLGGGVIFLASALAGWLKGAGPGPQPKGK